MTDDIFTRRGFALKDLSNGSIAYVLVKSPCDKVASALADHTGGKIIAVDQTDQFPERLSQGVGYITYQLNGHKWSLFACSIDDAESLPAVLSKTLSAPCIAFLFEDTSGWAALKVIIDGEEAEAMEWGPDMSDEMDEMAEYFEEMGQEPPDTSARYNDWHTNTKVEMGDEFFQEYLFRSKNRKVTAEELGAGDAFINELLISNDAYLPDLDEMPWADGPDGAIASQTLPASAFASILVVAKD